MYTHVALVADLNVEYSPHLDKPNRISLQSIMKSNVKWSNPLTPNRFLRRDEQAH